MKSTPIKAKKRRSFAQFMAALRRRKAELARKGIEVGIGLPNRYRPKTNLPKVAVDPEEETAVAAVTE